MKKIVVTALICCMACFAWSQHTIQGRVIDKNSQEPLELAYVRFSNTTKGVVTNKQGYFTLDRSANDTSLIISFIGFTTQEIKMADKTSITIEMEKGPVKCRSF